jgi:BASS family bile acid:Na+ symporter
MEKHPQPVVAVAEFIHANFLGFVLGSYVAAALWPAFGLGIRDVSIGAVPFFGQATRITLPMVMLAFLLLSAGLGVETAQLKDLVRSPRVLAAGLTGNVLVPIAFIFGVSLLLRPWHNPDEIQSLLVGLALVAAMPIAGSSTAWSQHANGNLALSLGLVVCSTLLSPLTAPVALHAVGWMTIGDSARGLHELASSGTGGFLAVSVIFPSLLGMAGRAAVGPAGIARVKPVLKLMSAMNLLLLNYANACVSLPQAVADPDWDFLIVILAIVVGMCVLAFASGWWIARLLRADAAQRTALLFGLGMSNNGTGLVLASLTLADHPRVLLPLLFYNLVQHVVAGGVDFVVSQRHG